MVDPHPERVVHVLTVQQDDPDVRARLERYRALLSDDECARENRFYFDADKERFVIGRALARLQLSRFLGGDPRSWPLVTNRYGRPELASRVSGLRERFVSHILQTVPGAILTGHRSQRLPSIASFCFPGTSGESVLLELERLGVVCSSGSACAAGSDAPSPVLLALGIVPEIAQTAVRFSFASTVTEAELEQAAGAVEAAVGRVRNLASPQHN